MKTVIIDNSLCSLGISPKLRPEHLYNYIEALGNAGVKYVEMDFSTVMKLEKLPDNVKYIFRLTNPVFSEMSKVYDFSYISVTLGDLSERLEIGDVPVILDVPAGKNPPQKLIELLQEQVSGKISMVRYCGSYPFMHQNEFAKTDWIAKRVFSAPTGYCPMNENKTALDSAIKLTNADVDCITLCMGQTNEYASLEEYVLSMMTIFQYIPKEFNISALCRAAVLYRIVFGKRYDNLDVIIKQTDYDIMNLRNADSGGRVKMPVSIKDKAFLRQSYVTALQQFMDEEGIPEDIAEEFSDAIRRFDVPLFSPEINGSMKNKLLN